MLLLKQLQFKFLPLVSFHIRHLSKEMAAKHRVCIVGSGNWGSAICRIVGFNCARYPQLFEERVNMWVFEENVGGKKLTEIINTEHENVKYLPGIKLPKNVVAVPNLVDAVKDATILIFVIPHQFVERTCAQLKGNINLTAIGLTLIKGVIARPDRLELISENITENLGIPMSALMGANIANEVAQEMFCEATVGSRYFSHGQLFKQLFETDYFRITVVPDVAGAELCGALKNVVACAAGFADGLKYGNNTKAAIIRLGLMEIIRFVELFHPGTSMRTFLQSCGMADLVTTCYGGRNRKVAQAWVETGKDLRELEQEILNGQLLQGMCIIIIIIL